MSSGYPQRKMRRLRYHKALRGMLQSVRLDRCDLVAPLFVREGLDRPVEIPTMPGQFQWPLALTGEHAKALADKGIPAVILFGIPQTKDALGSAAWADGGVIQRAIPAIKQAAGDLLVIADTCLCEYTDHGHCGVLASATPETQPGVPTYVGMPHVENEPSLAALARTAVSQARAGADVIAPSAMMDGQVRAIRTALDAAGFDRLPILSYAVKFASALYGPFREAAQSAPSFGDRRTYQMDPRAPRQILAEALADLEEGADMLMVKPAGVYLDVISALAAQTQAPLAAYHVSGEYAMIRFAAAHAAIDEQQAAMEWMWAIKRAGADFIITYFAEALAGWLGP